MLTTNHAAKYFLLTKATQAVRKLVSYYNQELSPLGITAPQMIALGVLCFQGNLSLGEFAFQMKIRKATAVSMIKRLETMGLVTKEAHPQDARLNVLNITEKTRKLIPKIQHKVAELENTIEDQIGASSLERIVRDFSMFIDVDLLKKDD